MATTAPPAPPAPVQPEPTPRRTVPPATGSSIVVWGVLVGLFIASIVAFFSLELSPERVARSMASINRFLGRAFPPEFEDWGHLLDLTLMTLAVVVVATVLSAVLSIPIAYCAARNTTPHPAALWIARGITVLARSIPEIVLLIILVTMMMIGALPVIVAIALHSIGMIAKLFADAIEQIDEGPRTAVATAGAGPIQQFVSGVFPQVAPSWIATVLHRFDINLRGTAVLGVVGMPGLGKELYEAISLLQYPRAMAAAIILFLLCVVVEIISTLLRGMILNRPSDSKSLGGMASRALDRARQNRATVPPQTPTRIRNQLFGVLAVAIVVWSVWYSQINWLDVLTFWAKIPERFSALVPLSFGTTPAPEMMGLLWETVYIALAGTLIALVLGAPLASFAARNVAPNSTVRGVARFILLVIRGIPELLLAIVLILATGFGPVAGAFALGIGGIGLLGKLLADSMEEVSSGPETALRAVGATRFQTYAGATLPQSFPAWIAHSLYMLDSNIRAATVLGVVGGGGVGQVMFEATTRSQYNVVVTIALMILAIVLVIEGLSILMRKLVSSPR